MVSNLDISFFENGETDKFVLEYHIWANLGKDLIFVPRNSRTDGGKILLFYPRERYVSVVNDGCQTTIAPIVGRTGLYIERFVTPALSGVEIKIIAEAESRNAPLLKGEFARETETGAQGTFAVCPLS